MSKTHKTSKKLFPLSSCGRPVYRIVSAGVEIPYSESWNKVNCKRCLQSKGKIDNRETIVTHISSSESYRKITIHTEITLFKDGVK